LVKLLNFGHVGLAIDDVNGFIKILNQLFQPFLSDQNLISLEQTEDIQGVRIMPNNFGVIFLSDLEVIIALLGCDNT
jgi:hypothetical protein